MYQGTKSRYPSYFSLSLLGVQNKYPFFLCNTLINDSDATVGDFCIVFDACSDNGFLVIRPFASIVAKEEFIYKKNAYLPNKNKFSKGLRDIFNKKINFMLRCCWNTRKCLGKDLDYIVYELPRCLGLFMAEFLVSLSNIFLK